MYAQDEDEDFNRMISDLAGSTQQPSSSVYTPPPAAAEPQLQERVKGRDFGVGDIAMLGGILASIFAKKPSLTSGLAAQYGGALMQDSQRRDAQNQEIDRYNNKLLNDKDEMARWQADTNAKLAAGNLEARNADLEARNAQEARIAQHQLDEADPNSDLNRAKMALEKERAGLDRETYRDRAKADQEAKLALLAQEYKYKQGAHRGKAADPIKQIQRAAVMQGLQDGSIDPVTLKPVVKPKTAAETRAEERAAVASTMIPGMKLDPENPDADKVYSAYMASQAGNRGKLTKDISEHDLFASYMNQLDELNAKPYSAANEKQFSALINKLIGGDSKEGSTGVLSNPEYIRYLKDKARYAPADNKMLQLRAADGIGETWEALKGKDVQQEKAKLAREGFEKAYVDSHKAYGIVPNDAAGAAAAPKTATKNGATKSVEGATESQLEVLRKLGWEIK